MSYVVIATTPRSVAIWDGKTRDKHGDPAGVMTPVVGPHEFKVDDRVDLVIRKVTA